MTDPNQAFVLNFRFHDIARVRVTSNHSTVNSFFKREYAYHLVDDVSAVDDLPLIDLTFFLSTKFPAGYVQHRHKFLAHWAYQMNITPDHAKISVFGNKYAIPMVHHMMLHATLRYFATRQDILMLHSGGVARNGKSMIFTGHGGTGKTTTTSLLLSSRSDWKLHADDYVFLRDGPVSLTYQTNLHLYQNLISILPEIAGRLNAWELVKLRIFGLVRKWSHDGITWPVRLSVNRVWPHREIQNCATPVAVIYLEKSNADFGLHKATNIPELKEAICEMNFYEARHFITLLQKSGNLKGSFLEEWKRREADILQRVLGQVPFYVLHMPTKNTLEYTQKMILPIFEELTKL